MNFKTWVEMLGFSYIVVMATIMTVAFWVTVFSRNHTITFDSNHFGEAGWEWMLVLACTPCAIYFLKKSFMRIGDGC